MMTETIRVEGRFGQDGADADAVGVPFSGVIPAEGDAPDILRLLAIGSPQAVQSCVLTLYRLGYARPED